MKFSIQTFRDQFSTTMVKVRENISELDRAGAELRRKVSNFCNPKPATL
jgi:hypothetical protein